MMPRVGMRAAFLLALLASTGFLRAEEPPQSLSFHLRYLGLYGRRETTLIDPGSFAARVLAQP